MAHRRDCTAKGIREMDADNSLQEYDYPGNLQLLEGMPNQEEADMDLREWLLQS